MAETNNNKTVDANDLAAYDSDEEINITNSDIGNNTGQKKTNVRVGGIHSLTFKDFLLKTELLKAIQDSGFEHPSEVQHECIPPALLGRDILCQAKSGMGKTAVFVLSVLHQLASSNPNMATNGSNTTDTSKDKKPTKQVKCLVLCNTRELAYQINNEFTRFKKYLPWINTSVFYGGVPIQGNRKVLSEEQGFPLIVIGTPGRILQLVQEKTLNLTNLKHFVLDEVDTVLESTKMRGDVQEIFKQTARQKQVMMFSATLNDEIRTICKKFMHDPVEIYINDGSKLTLHGLQQYYVEVSEKEKKQEIG